MIVIIKFEKNMASTYVFCIIIGKYSYWPEFNLVILLKIDKELKTNLYSFVLHFGLTINL